MIGAYKRPSATPPPATPLCCALTISTSEHHLPLAASHCLDKLAESCSSITGGKV